MSHYTASPNKFLIFVLTALAITSSMAQTASPVQNFGTEPRAFVHRQSFWTEFNFGGTISKNQRWQYQMDYQYRRGSDVSFIQGGSSSPFKEIQQQVFRPWVHYWAVPKVVRFSLSPVGFWVTWNPKEETSIYYNKDQVLTGQSVFPEFRICPQVTLFQNIGRVQFVNRFRYEFRFLGQRRAADNSLSDFGKGFDFAPTDIADQSSNFYGNNHIGRIRWQTRLQIPLGKGKTKVENNTWYINTWNELFLATGPRVGNNKLLNQNRFVAMVGYKLKSAVPIKIEAGITYQTLFQYNIGTLPNDPSITYAKNNVENNVAYSIYVIFDEFHQFFKKKKVSE
ncbi:MAG: DUF2490 domain-containing protein [Bacteroidetes bacterium]|nr:DUF2490 domain-containing protein [Bacteroidota bacterium]